MSTAVLATFSRRHDLIGTSACDGLSPEAWRTPVRAGINHPVWILSHVNRVRRAIARNLGADLPEESPASNELDASCLPADRYPSPEALVEEFRTLGGIIATRLASAPDSVLSATFQPDFPDGGKRAVRDAIVFLVSHESLHLGQISLLRRFHELPGVATVVMERMAAAK